MANLIDERGVWSRNPWLKGWIGVSLILLALGSMLGCETSEPAADAVVVEPTLIAASEPPTEVLTPQVVAAVDPETTSIAAGAEAVPTAGRELQVGETSLPALTPVPAENVVVSPASTSEDSVKSTPIVGVSAAGGEDPIGESRLWEEVFDALDADGRSCVESYLGESAYVALRSLPVSASSRILGWNELSFSRCLPQETAAEVFVPWVVSPEDAPGSRLESTGDSEGCYKAISRFADFERFFESGATDTWFAVNEGRTLLTIGLLRCSRNSALGGVPVYSARPINIGPNDEFAWRDLDGDLSDDEGNCIAETIGADRSKTFMDELILDGETDEFEMSIWGCLEQDTAAALFKKVVPFQITDQGRQVVAENLGTEDARCLDRVLASVDYPRLFSAGLDGVGLEDYRYGYATLIGVGLCTRVLPAIVEIDEYGDDLETATEIGIGEWIAGEMIPRFNTTIDLDAFKFDVVSGVPYGLDFTGDAGEITSMALYDDAGRSIFVTSEPIIWEPRRTGVNYLIVKGDESLAYTLGISISDYVDDFGDDFESAAELGIGGSIEGSIGSWREEDYFRFAADEGLTYQIDVSTRSESEESPLALELTLVDSAGEGLMRIDKRRFWEAPATDAYFLEVTGRRSGDYTVSISVVDYADDHADDANLGTRLSVDAEIEGELGEDGDIDFFTLEVERGLVYDINVDATNESMVNVEVTDPAGTTLDPKAAPFTWQANDTGLLTIRLSSQDIVDYVVSARSSKVVDDHPDDERTGLMIGEPIAGRIDSITDVDVFTFEAVEGQGYDFAVEPETFDQVLVRLVDTDDFELKHEEVNGFFWHCWESSVYFVYVESGQTGAYTLTVSESVDRVDESRVPVLDLDDPDDHGDTYSRATELVLGDPMPGDIGFHLAPDWDLANRRTVDVDVFSFDAEEGELYSVRIDVGSLPDSMLQLYDGARDRRTTRDPLAFWEVAQTGPHYVHVRGYGGFGDYEITVDRLVYSNDHGDDASSATRIGLDETLSGLIGLEREEDFFKFEASEGTTYQIDLISESLRYSDLTVRSEDGDHLASADTRLLWEAPESKDHFIVVSGPGSGRYGVNVKTSEIQDDHGDDRSSSTAISTGVSVSGQFSLKDVYDYFKVDVDGGQHYQVEVATDSPHPLWVSVYAAGESPVAAGWYEGGGGGVGATWRAPASGENYIAVSGIQPLSTARRYALVVGEIEFIDDFGDEFSSAVDIASSPLVEATIGVGNDEDYFVFRSDGADGVTQLKFVTSDHLKVLIYDANGELMDHIVRGHGNSDTAFVWDVPGPGEYHAVVSSSYGEAGAYTLQLLQSVSGSAK